MRVLSVVGTRPDFLKLASLDRALVQRGVEHIIVHTGREHDPDLSDTVCEELWIPAPDQRLGVGAGSPATQTAAVMQRLEPILAGDSPDIVLCYGDSDAALAAALVAAKLGLPVGHLDAGLRSGDWTTPEEINRVVTDRVSDVLFLPSRDGAANLRAEGLASDRMHFVGNVLIDAVCWALPRATERRIIERYGLAGVPYIVVTLARPSNVEDPAALRALLDVLQRLSRDWPVILPARRSAHDRLRATALTAARATGDGDIRLSEPLAYLDMLGLVAGAALVITDSGGLQDETTFLGVPCITVRPNTERTVTCSHGTNRLVAVQPEALRAAAARAIARRAPARPLIERWDGRAAERIVRVLCDDERFDDALDAVAPPVECAEPLSAA